MRPNIIEGVLSARSSVELVACPRCAAKLTFSRLPIPPIDSSGLESYSITCDQCGADLVGVIDPVDDRLLLSELKP